MGWVLVGGLVLDLASGACAQSSPGEYGGYPPAGNTNQAFSGANLSASYGMYPGGLPVTSYNQPNTFYGANYVLPQADSSSPVYYSYGTTSGQPTSYYGANYVLPVPGGQSPGIFTFGPTSGQPTSYYGANYYLSLPGNQFTYTNGPTNTSLPGVNSYARSVAPVFVPRTMPGRVTSSTNRTPSTIAPGSYFTPRLR